MLNNPEKYKHIFASKEGLENWCKTVAKMREWDGDDAFSVLVEFTRICIHVISTDFTSCQAIRTYTPRGTEGQDWETSVAVVYGSGHYRALIPIKLPTYLNLTDKLSSGPSVKIELECEDTDGKWKTVEKPKREKFPRNSSQKEQKYDKQKQENRSSIQNMFNKMKVKKNLSNIPDKKILEAKPKVEESIKIGKPDFISLVSRLSCAVREDDQIYCLQGLMGIQVDIGKLVQSKAAMIITKLKSKPGKVGKLATTLAARWKALASNDTENTKFITKKEKNVKESENYKYIPKNDSKTEDEPKLVPDETENFEEEDNNTEILNNNSRELADPSDIEFHLNSEFHAEKFKTFLSSLDSAAGLEDGECGRADTLQFYLEVKELNNIAEADMSKFFRFFPAETGGLVLRDSSLWNKCAATVLSSDDADTVKLQLELAAAECLKELQYFYDMFISLK